MYVRPGDATELFSEPLPDAKASERAFKLETQGFEVIALITPEHAAERQAVQQGLLSQGGAHLDRFVNETVRQLWRIYPGVSREAALEAAIFILTLAAGGRANLQDALLDEVHSVTITGTPDWRNEIRLAIANRGPEEET
jgi:cytochrome P450